MGEGTLARLNVIDIVVVALLIVAAFRGWRQGALIKVSAFGGAVAGLLIGGAFGPTVADRLIDQAGIALAVVTLTILVVGVLVGQALGTLLGIRLSAAAARTGAGIADSLLGVVVGLGTLVVVLWIGASVLAQGPIATVAREVRSSTVLATIDQTLPPPPDLFGKVAAFLDTRGFPQVFAGLWGSTAPPATPAAEGVVATAAAAGTPATVQVEGLGCGGVSVGSGTVVQQGFVVTNAHVVAGAERLNVRDAIGTHDATVIHIDPATDVAVLSAPSATATPLPWAQQPARRDTSGATLGYPGGQRRLNVRPAAVRGREQARGRDIYGEQIITREILTLDAGVRPGDSGGPFIDRTGAIAGIVFAASAFDDGVGYALTAESVRPAVQAAITANTAVATGACRY
ncbi:MarP family serine protease [soil metagenome]